MKKTILFIALITATGLLFAQKKTTSSGTVNFDATTSLDPLPKAENKAAIAAIDPTTGAVAFEVIMKNFTFENPKMQEHFNGEGWLNSEKYPTAAFKGNITNLGAVNFSKDGTYDADIAGDLTIHGVTKPVKTTGKITVTGDAIAANSEFSIKLADYGVDGPAVGGGKVSKEPKISVSSNFQ